MWTFFLVLFKTVTFRMDIKEVKSAKESSGIFLFFRDIQYY